MKRIILLSGLVVLCSAAYLAGGHRELGRLWLNARRAPETPRVGTADVIPGRRIAFADQQFQGPALPATNAAPEPQPAEPAQSSTPFAGASAPAETLTAQQRRFLDLSKKKARALKEDQLQRAIGDLEREVEGLNARSRLDEAIKILEGIATQHPQTEAGRAATIGLNAIRQYHMGVPPRSAVPDPVFERDSKPAPVDNSTFGVPGAS